MDKSTWILLVLMPSHPWGSLLCWSGLNWFLGAVAAFGVSKAAELSRQEAARRVQSLLRWGSRCMLGDVGT